MERELAGGDVAAVIIEGIQGVGGIHVPDADYLEALPDLCHRHGALLILDEVQSGYGRSGRFFAFQHSGVRPDIVTMAKGMGNGFPIGGVLIAPEIEAKSGMLGTTFGGSHLACAAGIAVLGRDRGGRPAGADAGAGKLPHGCTAGHRMVLPRCGGTDS